MRTDVGVSVSAYTNEFSHITMGRKQEVEAATVPFPARAFLRFSTRQHICHPGAKLSEHIENEMQQRGRALK